jgi:hypothetical protein
MERAWNWLVLVCAVYSAILIGWTWYSGEPAWWFVWVSAIWFSVDVGFRSADKLLDAA